MTRKICVFTGTRADYGHLYWIIKHINDDPDLALQLLVSGSHLETEFGETWTSIVEDGFIIDEKVKIIQSGDNAHSVANSMGVGINKITEALGRLNPQVIIILGDRYEALAAALGATLLNIPIAHIHGGELTDGAMDNAFRHAITKLAHIHFAATEQYRQRIIQMGEQSNLVFDVGAPGLDHLNTLESIDRNTFESKINFKLAKSNFLVTFHPVTLGKKSDNIKSLSNLMKALDRFPEANILITKSNVDSEGRKINSTLESYAKSQPNRVSIHASLGQRLFYAALNIMDVIIGNSSSGIIEAPVVGIPTVNIGTRQLSRMQAPSIINCDDSVEEITNAIQQSLSTEFKMITNLRKSPYGVGNASKKIVETLKSISIEGLLLKKFNDYETI